MSVLHLSAETAKERLDVFLARTMPDHSRTWWQKHCEQGFISTEGKERSANYLLHTDEIITIILPDEPDFSQTVLPVLYEDDAVLVINKPAGILTHAKGTASTEFSVAEFVRPRTTDGTATNRPGIVHRLDRGTSGILIAARNSEAKQWLQKQFAQRKVKKAYIALVQGHLDQAQAMIDLPIARNPRKPQTFRVDSNGKPAQTAYETLRVLPNHTFIKLRPLTGRTHQLRVHMAYLNHPIVGDALYGKVKARLNRLFLHAAELELTLPSRQHKLFTAPLPPELERYVQQVI